jgi:hypothetical protein
MQTTGFPPSARLGLGHSQSMLLFRHTKRREFTTLLGGAAGVAIRCPRAAIRADAAHRRPHFVAVDPMIRYRTLGPEGRRRWRSGQS